MYHNYNEELPTKKEFASYEQDKDVTYHKSWISDVNLDESEDDTIHTIGKYQGGWSKKKSTPEYMIIFSSEEIDQGNRCIDEKEKFLTDIKTLHQIENKDMAVKLVYQYFGKLVINKEYAICNEILKEIDKENYSTWVLLPFLTLSLPYKHIMPHRADLFGSTVIKFLEIGKMTNNQILSSINRLK